VRKHLAERFPKAERLDTYEEVMAAERGWRPIIFQVSETESSEFPTEIEFHHFPARRGEAEADAIAAALSRKIGDAFVCRILYPVTWDPDYPYHNAFYDNGEYWLADGFEAKVYGGTGTIEIKRRIEVDADELDEWGLRSE
jgi:hypothetical protein